MDLQLGGGDSAKMAKLLGCTKLKIGRVEEYFRKGRKIGAGAQGTVYLATPTAKGKKLKPTMPSTVVIKHIVLPQPEPVTAADLHRNPWLRDHYAKDFSLKLAPIVAEIQILKYLDLPNNMKYYGCLTNKQDAYIVMEHVEGATLLQGINSKSFNPAQKISITVELHKAISDLHGAGVIHRDIKPENILCKVVDDATVKVTLVDYGMSCIHKTKVGYCTGEGGTPAYVDPRQEIGSVFSMMLSDWWAFGQTMVTLHARFRMYDEEQGQYRKYSDLAGLQPHFNRIPGYKVLAKFTDPSIPQSARPTVDELLASMLK
mgnify:CR=1 FL=1